MSRNLKVFLGGALVFYFVGFMNDAAVAYVLSGICLAVVAGCYWLSRLAVAGLQVDIHLSRHEVAAGNRVPVRVTLTNTGLISRPAPIVALRVTNQTIPHAEQALEFGLPSLSRGEVAEATVETVLPVRGRWHVGPAQLIGTDPVGMFRRPGPQSASVALLALPEVFSVPWVWRRDLLCREARHLALSRVRQGGEFWGIRQHEPGDGLRHVHWKVTAHTGELMVKEYARGRELSAAIWLDLRAASHVGHGVDSSLEMSIILAASLVPAFLAMDQAVALVGDGLPLGLRTPGRGEATAARAWRALAEVQPTSSRPFAELISHQLGEARPGLTAVTITPGVESGLERALLSAVSRGVAVRCLVAAPPELLSDSQRANQSRLVTRLRQAGVPVAMAGSRRELRRAVGELAAAGEERVAAG
ncbi:MAG: DUF58 domain-containing protein [Armatimonadetes bacterium]|nr:DUF58 domain-containing protein [Armatimonadota bacterium]